MPLPVAYQNQFKSVYVNAYWLPESPIDLDTDFQNDMLSQSEIKTLSAITSPSMYHQKTWSFLLTRTILGRVLGQDPKTIVIDRVGKPKLVNTTSKCAISGRLLTCQGDSRDPPLYFNVSHSKNLWALAWSYEKDVGIDVQKIDTSINYQAIMRQFFTASERAKIKTVFDFFDIWTQKEAALKLRGLSFAHIPKISTHNVELIFLDIASEFKAHLAFA